MKWQWNYLSLYLFSRIHYAKDEAAYERLRPSAFDNIDEDEISLHNLDSYGRNVPLNGANGGNYRPYDDYAGRRYYLEHKLSNFLPMQQVRFPPRPNAIHASSGNQQSTNNIQPHQLSLKRAIDSIGGANLLKRAVDRLGGGNLLRRR